MWIELDGSQGEGGGQILRTALSLSMCTGKPVLIQNIRAKRRKPGLMRQHLTAVNAATEICGARVEGAHAGSQSLAFEPGPVKAGEYHFAIGTAGSCTLVFQTILPALVLRADSPSRVILEGGTHNPLAPPFHFLERAFLPLLGKMGVRASLELERFGFYPAGGGRCVTVIEPASSLTPLEIPERGERTASYAEAYIAALPIHIAKRELEKVETAFRWPPEQLRLRGLNSDQGPGNALMITLEHEHVTEVFSGFAEKGVTAENVADRVIGEARTYIASTGALGPHLADQMLLWMALAGKGSFTLTNPTPHFTTNAAVIREFLEVGIGVGRDERGCWGCEIIS